MATIVLRTTEPHLPIVRYQCALQGLLSAVSWAPVAGLALVFLLATAQLGFAQVAAARTLRSQITPTVQASLPATHACLHLARAAYVCCNPLHQTQLRPQLPVLPFSLLRTAVLVNAPFHPMELKAYALMLPETRAIIAQLRSMLSAKWPRVSVLTAWSLTSPTAPPAPMLILSLFRAR
jgi:hypothetical protein